MSSFPVQLNGIEDLVLLQEMLGILGQEWVDLFDIVGFSQIYGHIPLVQSHTAVYGCLDVVTLSEKNQNILTLVLLIPDILCLCKQCRSRSVGFWRSQLIWICTVCNSVYEVMSTIWINETDWLKLRSRQDISIYSAWQGLKCDLLQVQLAF